MHERFLKYRDMGRMRSLTGLNVLLADIGDLLTYGTIRVQSHLFRWTERAQAWDRYQDEQDRDRLMKARREMLDRHQMVSSALMKRALIALRQIDPRELSAADVYRWIKLATDIEIRVFGEPSQTIAVTGPSGGPVLTEDITGMDQETRRNRMRELVSELAGRVGMSTILDEEDEEYEEDES